MKRSHAAVLIKFGKIAVMRMIGYSRGRNTSSVRSRRKKICDSYTSAFSKYNWAEAPLQKNAQRESCYHLYPLRIKGINEKQRDEIIKEIFVRDVSVNVHFIPVPMMSFYKKLGYKIKNYPNAYNNYSRAISLPVYYDLTDELVQTVIEAVVNSVEKTIK